MRQRSLRRGARDGGGSGRGGEPGEAPRQLVQQALGRQPGALELLHHLVAGTADHELEADHGDREEERGDVAHPLAAKHVVEHREQELQRAGGDEEQQHGARRRLRARERAAVPRDAHAGGDERRHRHEHDRLEQRRDGVHREHPSGRSG
jgi:hypothetical protein